MEEYTPIEKAIGDIYVALYRLRKADKIQEEYDAMNIIINMLMKDRDFVRTHFRDKIKI